MTGPHLEDQITVMMGGRAAEEIIVFVYRIESPVKSKYFHKIVDKSCGFGYLKLDEWERVQRVCQS